MHSTSHDAGARQPAASPPGIRAISLLLLLLTAACGGSGDGDDSPGPVDPPPSQVGFSGSYNTSVTLTSTTCGPINVQDNPTAVTHTQSSGAITLTHAGTTYDGTVAADSTFSTNPISVDVGDGYQYFIVIAGRFRVNAFEADATVDRSGVGDPCRYVVHWMGSR